MDGMCVALGYVYRMNGFIVNRVLRGIARDRLVLALAQEYIENRGILRIDLGCIFSLYTGSDYRY